VASEARHRLELIVMHWTHKHLSELIGLGLTVMAFSYTGAATPNMVAGMVCVAVSIYVIRRLFGA
jgi:hypothetical protein